LRRCKENGWFSGGGRHQEYVLSSDGAWRDALKSSLEEGLERERLEYVVEQQTERIQKLEVKNRRLTGTRKAIAAGAEVGGAVAALTAIMHDQSVAPRRRLQAAGSILSYRAPQDVTQHAKAFLASIFGDPAQNVDLRLAAAEQLRKSEDVRLMPPIERPAPPSPPRDEAAEEAEREAEHLRKVQHLQAQLAADQEEMARDWQRLSMNNGRAD
jgi:hypothetical protein